MLPARNRLPVSSFVLTIALLASAACDVDQPTVDMARASLSCDGNCGELLGGTWVNRAEEGDAGEFARLVLRSDGTVLSERQSGDQTRGQWRLESHNLLRLEFGDDLVERFRLQRPESVDAMRLLAVTPSNQPAFPLRLLELSRVLPGFCAIDDDCVRQPLPRPGTPGSWHCTEEQACQFSASICLEDLESETSAALSTTDAPSGRTLHTATWSGSEMIVWGGFDGAGAVDSGGRYDPATDSWQPMTTEGAPSARWDAIALWTGTELAVLGGRQPSGTVRDGGLYDPATDSWRPIRRAPGRVDEVVWTGTELLVQLPRDWAAYDLTAGSWRLIPELRGHELVAAGGGDLLLKKGAALFHYDMSEGSLHPLENRVVDVVRGRASATDDGRVGFFSPAGKARLLDLRADVTRVDIEQLPALSPDIGPTYLGREFAMCWEQRPNSSHPDRPTATLCRRTNLADGSLHDDVVIAPWAHTQGEAVWTGEELLVWGGRTVQVLAGFEFVEEQTQRGIRYQPPGCL